MGRDVAHAAPVLDGRLSAGRVGDHGREVALLKPAGRSADRQFASFARAEKSPRWLQFAPGVLNSGCWGLAANWGRRLRLMESSGAARDMVKGIPSQSSFWPMTEARSPNERRVTV